MFLQQQSNYNANQNSMFENDAMDVCFDQSPIDMFHRRPTGLRLTQRVLTTTVILHC